MKQRIEKLWALARRVDRKARHLWLASAITLSGAAQAQSSGTGSLPTIPPPTSGIGGTTISGTNDWIGSMGGWIKLGLTIMLFAVAGYIVLAVASGGVTKWRGYSMGRIDVGELKEYAIMGTVFVVFVIALVTYALGFL